MIYDRLKQNMNLFNFELSVDDIRKIETLEKKKSLFGWYD